MEKSEPPDDVTTISIHQSFAVFLSREPPKICRMALWISYNTQIESNVLEKEKKKRRRRRKRRKIRKRLGSQMTWLNRKPKIGENFPEESYGGENNDKGEEENE
ncbi:hypothetical protein B9Z55_000410 [Caenorhabditis nigoni]|uniref:Uncharacterized protein n=1 Tax=Caenorhabditis nigoni TaxID=1611254 RepID=A0A2G5VT12_9PELO|nr:hypothetical protein B9Z55_000410 [Caenorhabditis nigoni]